MRRFVHKHALLLLLSLITGALSILIFPYLQPYTIEFFKESRAENNWVVSFRDLNKDGKSEKLIFISDSLGFSSLIIYEGVVVHGQWRFKGKFPKGAFYSYGDYDKNGKEETYIFTICNDSLFLNAIESYTSQVIIKNKAIRKLHLINGISDILLNPALLTDLNFDNVDELLFTISTGYNYKDRVMCAYFVDKDSMIKTGKSASCISFPYNILKEDSNLIIAGMIREPGNTELSYPYTDQLAWFMAWDENLNYLFEPIEIGEYPALIFVKPFVKNDKLYFAGLYDYMGVHDSSKIFIANRQGDIIKQKALPYLKSKTAFLPNDTEDELTIIDSDGNIITFDNNLNRKGKIQGEKIYYYDLFREDITGDGIPDKIFFSDNFSRCVFFDPVSLKMIPVDISLQGEHLNVSKYSIDGEKYINFHLNGKNLLYHFSDNLLYKFRYLIPFVLIVVFLLLVFSVKAVFNYYLNKKMSRQNQISKLQLLNVKSRLDSHFTFNMIDCIGNSFRKNDFETADKLFIRYARLLQQSVQLSGEIAIPLEQELGYIENYLTLEKIRSNNMFDFNIHNSVKSQIDMPKFMLFTFVENAVKHGVLPLKDRKGHISVEIRQKNKIYEVEITDNGTGMDYKNKNLPGTGNGLKIIDQLIKLFKTEYGLIINYIISNNEPGTIITITMRYGN